MVFNTHRRIPNLQCENIFLTSGVSFVSWSAEGNTIKIEEVDRKREASQRKINAFIFISQPGVTSYNVDGSHCRLFRQGTLTSNFIASTGEGNIFQVLYLEEIESDKLYKIEHSIESSQVKQVNLCLKASCTTQVVTISVLNGIQKEITYRP